MTISKNTYKPNLTRIEFWTVTVIYIGLVFFLFGSAVHNEGRNVWTPNSYYFEQANITFDYYKHYFFPHVLKSSIFYMGFLALNFVFVPSILKKKSTVSNIIMALFCFSIIWVVLSVCDTYYKEYVFKSFQTNEDAYNYLFQINFVYTCWLMFMYGLYCVVKFAGEYLLANSDVIHKRYTLVTSDLIYAFVFWMIFLFLMLLIRIDHDFIVGASINILIGIIIYGYAQGILIPKMLVKRKALRAYILNILLIVLILAFPIGLLVTILTNDKVAIVTSLFTSAFQILVVGPLAWIIYKRQIKGKEEILYLRTALGKSTASFDFLRSQINPHFLFNALNTIYGTALQENATRTSEGVERLGNMMRFMLHENMQEKIPLNREVEYLNNYIDLQKLRTVTSPEVKIDTHIQQEFSSHQISPMLLIPFVENAFKHGLSLQETSHIKISLQIKGDTLYFDVNNSIHVKPDHDPEKDQSGIGLENVQQRLQLLYPGRHELSVRNSGLEFFIHLTIILA